MPTEESALEDSEAAYKNLVLSGKLRFEPRDRLSELEEELTNHVCDCLDSLPDTIIEGGRLFRNIINGNYLYSVSVYAPYRKPYETERLVLGRLRELDKMDGHCHGIKPVVLHIGEIGNEMVAKLEFVMPDEIRCNNIYDFLDRDIIDIECKLLMLFDESYYLYT